MTSILYAGAALAEVGACFSFWAWSRLGASWHWLVAGCGALVLFGLLLSMAPSVAVERVVPGFLGVYIGAGLLWAWIAEGLRPSEWSMGEGAVCAFGLGLGLLALR